MSVRIQTATQLILDGTGVLSLVGYYDTPATMTFTGIPGTFPIDWAFDLECIAGTGIPPTYTPTPTETPLVSFTPLNTPTPVGPISLGSSITINGEFYPMGGTDLADATRIEFELSDPVPIVSNVTIDFVGGGYMGDNVILSDFDFLPVLDPDPVEPLFVHELSGDFRFRLNTVSVRLQTATQLILDGTGVLSLTGYADTPAIMTFTGGPGIAPIDWEFDLLAIVGAVTYVPVHCSLLLVCIFGVTFALVVQRALWR